MAAHKTVGEYLQVDLDEDKLVSKVATQGRANTNEWVSQFMLKTRLDQKTTWVAYPYSSNRSTVGLLVIGCFYSDMRVLFSSVPRRSSPLMELGLHATINRIKFAHYPEFAIQMICCMGIGKYLVDHSAVLA